MKKSVVFVALFAVIAGAMAQDMKVQSAYSDMKNERLAYAKKNIDDAMVHEKTKDDAKTWAYAGLIYAQIVQEANNKDASKAVKKQLKEIKEPIEQICQQGISHLRKAIEIEQNAGTHEYLNTSMEALKSLCGAEAYYTGEFYNKGTDYAKAAEMWGKVVDDARFTKYDKLLDDALYYQADCYRMINQKDKELALYRELAKNDTKRPDVYIKIYADNKEKGDTTKAINALKKGVKMTKDEKSINNIIKTELASAYLWAGKTKEADDILNDMMTNAGNDVSALNGIAKIYGEQGNLTKAEEFYNKSLAVDAKQIDALRGMGNAFFNKAVKEHKIADAIPLEEVEAYDKKIKEVYEIYEKSIPYFENSLKIEEMDFESLNKLRLVYSIFNARTDVDAATKESYKAKFQDYDAKVKKLTRK
ncbi:MAG: tetratricopeptide repeat protein [Bacteroidales bacterium]|nr:tetratricopeptide repeat protein [Bacteroidales bacterium]